jgi:para-nitrobenzyl esterase
MMSAFVAFARSGDPNNPRLPEWKPYDAASRATMVINEECKAIDDFRGVERTASAPLLGVVPAAMLRGPLFRGVD